MRHAGSRPQTLEDAAREACDRLDLIWRPGIPSDGAWHRIDIQGDARGKEDGSIRLFPDGIGGIAQNWKLGAYEPFFVNSPGVLSPEESARRALIRRQAEEELGKLRAKALWTANKLWERSTPGEVATHPYVVKKGIEPLGARLLRDAKRGNRVEPAVVIPVFDIDTGKLITLQRIFADSEKRFLKWATSKNGQCVLNPMPRGPVLVGEGWATLVTAIEATGYQGVVAFSRAGLRAVAAHWLRQGRQVIILAELDADGMKAAKAAADGLGVFLAIPDFTGLEKTASDTDFNDLAAKSSLGRVRKQIKAAITEGGRRPGKLGGEPDRLDKGSLDEQSKQASAGGHPRTESSKRDMTHKHMNGKTHMSADDLIRALEPSYEDELAIIHPPQLIKRLLPKEGLTIMGGQSGAGKTFIAIAMAVALASGTPFFGYPVRERVGVIYIAAEGRATIGARLHAAKAAAGLRDPLPICVIKRPPALALDAKAYAAFAAQLASLAKQIRDKFGMRVGAIMLDTVSAAITLKDENANAEIAAVCQHMRMLGDACAAVTIAIHHFGKDAEKGLRGASAWKANSDHCLSILADRKEDTGKVEKRSLNIIKNQVGDEGPVSGFELMAAKIGINQYDEIEWSASVKPTELPPEEKAEKGEKYSYQLITRQAVNEAIITGASIRNIRRDGPVMRCVTLNQVKREFYNRWITGGDSGRSGAWKRAEKFIQGNSEFGKEVDHNGFEWVWLIKSEVVRSSTEDSETSR